MKDWRIKTALRRKLGALLIAVLVLGMMPGNGVAVSAEGKRSESKKEYVKRHERLADGEITEEPSAPLTGVTVSAIEVTDTTAVITVSAIGGTPGAIFYTISGAGIDEKKENGTREEGFELKNLQPNTKYAITITVAEEKTDGGEDTASQKKTEYSFNTKKTDLSGAKVKIDGSYTYTGSPIEPSPEAIHVSLNNKEIAEEEYVVEEFDGDNINAGTVSVIIKARDNGNYTGTASGSFIISKVTPNIGTVTAEPLKDTLDVEKVILHREKEEIPGKLKLKDDVVLTYGTQNYNWEFIPEKDNNYNTTSGSVSIAIQDTISPTAIYQIIGKEILFVTWDTEDSTAERIYCNIGTKLTILPSDNKDMITGSGIKETKYYIAKSDEKIENIESINWIEYNNPVPLNEVGSSIIYIKVTDKAENISFLKSNPIIVYEASSVEPKEITYIYKEATDTAVQINLNGNDFKGLKDENKKTLIENKDYILNKDENSLTIKADHLNTLKTGKHTYFIETKPQGMETEEELGCNLTIEVTAKTLQVAKATVEGREYNGTDKVDVTDIVLEGIVENDDVSVDISKVMGTLDSQNAGTYDSVNLSGLVLTGSAAGNYQLKETTSKDVPTTVTIDKASYNNLEQRKRYSYSKETKEQIDLSKLLPKECNTATYGAITTTGRIVYKAEPSCNGANLSYTISSGGTIGAAGTITIPVETQNYKDFKIVIHLTLTEKMPVSLKEGTEISVNGSLAYGELLSNLKLSGEFVDESGKPVNGRLEWKHSRKLPKVNEKTAVWIFTPEDAGTYETEEGNAEITVNKAIPSISKLPTASEITYGDILNKSTLSGGSAEHKDGTLSGTEIKGSFYWKDGSQSPVVADSNQTKYEVVFEPSEEDAANYEQATCSITLNVKKAPNPPERPNSTIDARGYDKVGDVPLPEGWQWRDTDITLIEGAGVGAVAYYDGADKENYENVTVTITLTKYSTSTPSYPSGGHQHFFSSKITKEPTCTSRGIRTYSCLCGASYTEEMGEFGEHQYTSQVTKQPTATTEGVRTYTCSLCRASYTEAIAKLSSGKDEKPAEEEKPDAAETTVSKTTLEKNAVTMNTKLKVGQIGSKIYVEWGRISGADGYDVYVQYCGKDFTSTPSESIKGTERAKVAVSKIGGKKLDLKKNYKIYVAAYKLVGGKKVSLGKSITAHGIGRKNEAYTNASEIVLKKDSYSLESGASATISASTVRDDKNKKLLSDAHAKEFRYASSNEKVATVSSSGKIKAVGEGSCTIYVYSRNGYAETVKVTVK